MPEAALVDQSRGASRMLPSPPLTFHSYDLEKQTAECSSTRAVPNEHSWTHMGDPGLLDQAFDTCSPEPARGPP